MEAVYLIFMMRFYPFNSPELIQQILRGSRTSIFGSPDPNILFPPKGFRWSGLDMGVSCITSQSLGSLVIRPRPQGNEFIEKEGVKREKSKLN